MPLASARQIAATAGGSVNTAAVCCQTRRGRGGGGWPGDSDEGVIMEVRASSWVGGAGSAPPALRLLFLLLPTASLGFGRQKRAGGEDEDEPRG